MSYTSGEFFVFFYRYRFYAARRILRHSACVDFPRTCDTMKSGGMERFMKLTSTAFADGKKLPKEFAKMGANRIPPLKIEGVPDGAKSLAVIMHDPDAPMAGGFYHWTLWNIPPETTAIGEGAVPRGALEGKTSWGTSGYNGPQPPFGTHRYIFYLYALDAMLDLPAGSDVQALKNAISGHEIESASLTGMFGVLDNFRK